MMNPDLQLLTIHLVGLPQTKLQSTTKLLQSLKKTFQTSAFRAYIGRTKDEEFAPISVTFFKQHIYDRAMTKFDEDGIILVNTGAEELVPLELEIPKAGAISPSVSEAAEILAKYRTPEMIVEEILAKKNVEADVDRVIKKATSLKPWTICVNKPEDVTDYNELHKQLSNAFSTKKFAFYVDKQYVYVTFFSQMALTLGLNYNQVFERPAKLPVFNPMSCYLAAIKCMTSR